MPDFSYEVLQSFFVSLRSALSWLGDCISGVFDVVKSSPLYYMPLLLITVIGIIGGIALLIFEVSDRAYMQENYSPLQPEGIKGWKLSSLNSYGYYSRYDTSPLGSMLISNYKKRKRQRDYENKLAQEAYEKVVEEQAALESQHRLEEEREILHGVNQWKAAEFFKNNPGRYKVTIDKMDFYNDEKVPWYMKKYSYNGNSDESSKPSYDLDEAVKKATVRAKDLK